MKINTITYIGNDLAFLKAISLEKIESVDHYKNCNAAYAHIQPSSNKAKAIFIDLTEQEETIVEFISAVKNLGNVQNSLFIGVDADDSEKGTALFNDQMIDEIIKPCIDCAAVVDYLEKLAEYKTAKKSKKTAKKKTGYSIPFLKRAFDITVAGALILALSPLLIVVTAMILIESGYPVIYKSKRVGTGYKTFDFLKFRSMKNNADKALGDLKDLNQYNQKNEKEDLSECITCKRLEKPCSPLLLIDGEEVCETLNFKRKKLEKEGTFIKIANDPRVTKFGQFIRNLSIDELPQLFNVLKGDMSIVGNRPLPLYEAEQLTVDKWAMRFNAPAGITGLWQVEKRGQAEMSEYERKMLDNKYASNASFWGDIKLLIKTIPAVFQKEAV